jgi:hypothetical protein
MAKKEYFEFTKNQSKPLKYLETSGYVVCGLEAAQSHEERLNKTAKEGVFWSMQKTSRRVPLLSGRLTSLSPPLPRRRWT